uniref:Protein FAM234B-like n=1 Tax=Sinocyclocheilus rhinocerous TaxID=307959 RepID=A0A673H9C3_9TELE
MMITNNNCNSNCNDNNNCNSNYNDNSSCNNYYSDNCNSNCNDNNNCKGAMRSAAFLLPLSCAALLVLLCAFLIPCPQGAPLRTQWERELGDTAGVTSPPIALWDVDGDGLEDVLIGITNFSNDSQPMNAQSKEFSVLALGGGGGQLLWRKLLREPLISVQCGLQTGSSDPLHSSACVLISSGHMIAINASTGWTLWTTDVGDVESHAVLLPDLQGDAFPDLLIATLPEDQVTITGAKTFSHHCINTHTHTHTYKRTDSHTHTQTHTHIYIYKHIHTHKEPSWEHLRKSNSSSLIHISSVSERVDFLLSLVVGSCQRLRNLDGVSALNCSRSDWIVLSDSSRRLSVLRASDTRPIWSLGLASIRTRLAAGHFNDDGVPDLLVHRSANGVRKVQIVDGARGRSLWEAEFVCPRLAVEDSSVLTVTGQSVFLFWAGDPLAQPQNVSKVAEPVLRKLFLLHPNYPTILLELSSTTDTILSAAGDVSSRPSARTLGAQMLQTLSLRATLADARILRLTDAADKPSAFQLRKFFRRLAFRQVQQQTAEAHTEPYTRSQPLTRFSIPSLPNTTHDPLCNTH